MLVLLGFSGYQLLRIYSWGFRLWTEEELHLQWANPSNRDFNNSHIIFSRHNSSLEMNEPERIQKTKIDYLFKWGECSASARITFLRGGSPLAALTQFKAQEGVGLVQSYEYLHRYAQKPNIRIRRDDFPSFGQRLWMVGRPLPNQESLNGPAPKRSLLTIMSATFYA